MQGATFPYVAYDAYGSAATRRAVNKHLSPEVQAVRARHEALWEQECDTILTLCSLPSNIYEIITLPLTLDLVLGPSACPLRLWV
jgi:hypothetical protein